MIFQFEVLPGVYVYRESFFPPDSTFIQTFRLHCARLFEIPWERIKVKLVANVSGPALILPQVVSLTESSVISLGSK